ncbi:PREDICTED: Golgi SNAP receptor complex member 2-like [Rhagoletis zephyria]|uniref:Golgi SNAP receptor complex member 2-like n=1 Tax=Rhagoletis zephyria TaxID=28612 RepID=UPI0008113FC3|nr:PREDICTED: Golgi SNAP receptor complex member 2-like [Rhagoletis zephyria]
MEHFTSASRLINEVQESLFPKLESCHDAASLGVIEGAIDERVKQLEAILDRLEMSVNKATPAQRSSLKFKLDQLRQEHRQLKTTLGTIHQRRLHREREQREREELLHRRFTTNDSLHQRSGLFGADQHQQTTNIEMPNSSEQYFSQEGDRLHGFHRQVDDMLAQGAAVIGSLREQRASLQSVRSRIVEVLGTLGLSNSVMRLIEKRVLTDRYILFALMALFTLFMFLVWKYLT